MRLTCAQCGRKVDKERQGVGAGWSGADHLFNRPDGSEVWLCGRPVCLQKYNEEKDVPCSCKGSHECEAHRA